MSTKDTPEQGYLDFDEYIRQGDPSQREKASLWQTAIGLQAVDGLQTSDYLKSTALTTETSCYFVSYEVFATPLTFFLIDILLFIL